MGLKYYVEVKGHAGPLYMAELSENEYRAAEEHKNHYIVCVVPWALKPDPPVICKPYPQWRKKEYVKTTRVILEP